MADKRADTLLQTMQFARWYTLDRAWDGLSDDELFWEPVAGSWRVRRRAECQTATPFGDGDWVVDFDADLTRAADQGEAVEPLTTIGWLLWHIGSMPGRLAQLDFLGGSRTARQGWTSCYLNVLPVFTRAAEGVDAMRAGWQALERALRTASDDDLERPARSYNYRDEPGPPALGDEPGPLTHGAAIVAATLNEVSHHGTQICMLRGLYRATGGRSFAAGRAAEQPS